MARTKSTFNLHSNSLRTLNGLVLLASMLLMSACGQLDRYATRFPQVDIGDSRARVIGLMGQRPDHIVAIEAPVLKAEQLEWRAPGNGHVYLVLIVMDRAVAKLSVE